MVIVGGGIGGLAAALAAARAGLPVQLLEQAPAFGEVGAGIQLGPNVVRVLQAWGLDAHNSHTNVCSSSAPAPMRAPSISHDSNRSLSRSAPIYWSTSPTLLG